METVTKKSATIETRKKNLFTFGGCSDWFDLTLKFLCPPFHVKLQTQRWYSASADPAPPTFPLLCVFELRKYHFKKWFSIHFFTTLSSDAKN